MFSTSFTVRKYGSLPVLPKRRKSSPAKQKMQVSPLAAPWSGCAPITSWQEKPQVKLGFQFPSSTAVSPGPWPPVALAHHSTPEPHREPGIPGLPWGQHNSIICLYKASTPNVQAAHPPLRLNSYSQLMRTDRWERLLQEGPLSITNLPLPSQKLAKNLSIFVKI